VKASEEPQAGNAPSPLLNRLLDQVKREHGGKDPYSMIVFTNHPHQYTAKDEKDPKKHLYPIVSDDTYVPQVEALLSLHQAVTLYGNIPNEFPASESSRDMKIVLSRKRLHRPAPVMFI
jgi:hypothetical protein